MKKTQILKIIVDIIWIVTAPIGVPFILVFIPIILFYDFANLEMKIMGIELLVQSTFSKTLAILSLLNFLLIIYSLHLFRKTLRYFLNTKVFDVFVIDSFRNIGNILTISGVVSTFLSVTGSLYFDQKLRMELGLNSNLTLIGLGIFFMILSDVFHIAKSAKQENDLTI